MLRKKTNGVTRRPARSSIIQNSATTVDRRGFLRGSGLAIGGLAAIAATGGTVTQADAAATATTGDLERIKSVCTSGLYRHCRSR
jgi:formate dehydrogenase major subunit